MPNQEIQNGDRKMKIGLIDVDNYDKLDKCFPNLALMKLSAWHKKQGDEVVWYDAMFTGRCDMVYMSKVFSFSPDYPYHVDANIIIKGGSGYCIEVVDGKEVYHKERDIDLPYEVEHIMPDYSLYGITDTAYGFMSRGCPRGCAFCHVEAKEGKKAYKVADLNEFWDGQKNIVLMDANTLACREWKGILGQLKESGAYVDFNQGLDIRLMTKEKAEAVKEVKTKFVHFAFDRWQDKELIEKKLATFKEITGWKHGRVSVYVLCNFDTTLEQDLERIKFLRSLDFSPYVMLYNKQSIPKGHIMRKLQRWVNNRFVFWSCENFEDYLKGEK